MDDETLKMYVEESLEHLSGIENDFLSIEESGANIDEELVNKVFRAAHSIKGGAGFIGLTVVKELAHKMENVLGMIRGKEIVPDKNIINTLLNASDILKGLLENAEASNDAEIDEHLNALQRITENSGKLEEERDVLADTIDILVDDNIIFSIPEPDIDRAKKRGKHIYFIELDLINDLPQERRDVSAVIKELENIGIILDCKIDFNMSGKLEDEFFPVELPFFIVFSSIADPDVINSLFNFSEKKIFSISDDIIIRDGKGLKVFIRDLKESENHIESKEIKIIENEISSDIKESSSEVKEKSVEKEKKKADKRNKVNGTGSTKKETSLRVSVEILDSLMNLAGELVLSRNQLLQAVNSFEQREIEIAGQRVNMITSDLQEAIMFTRMQPIGNVFNKFPRVVRDMAFDLGKEMELSLEGKEVELDKTIIEGISDPLTHLVRNAADHGIEKPDERKKLGKNPKGKILLRAFHEAGQVNIEIIDDGKGLDVNKIKEKALAKNLITEEETNAFSDKEALNLIFLPGFSTAAKVTDVSGRGVGMDVVKTNLDRLGGTVEVSTKKGKGTEVKIRLPLTLAIIPSLIISTAGERYAIPQVNMAELLRIKASEVKDKIEKVGNAEVVRLRGRLLPLVRLKDVLEDEPHFIDPETGRLRMDRRKNIADRRSRRSEVDEEKGQEKEKEEKEFEDQRKGGDRRYHAASAVNIVVVSTGNFQYGLVVDTLHDSEEIVVKPLGRHLKKCEGYAGATIMGDGRVALILDVGNIAKMAQLNSLENTKRAKEVAEEKIKSQDTQSFLIFMNSQDEQFAVPLSLVNRIERIKIDDIEEIGGRRIIQYRGKSLPVFSINEVANVKPLEQRDILEVIIFKIGGNEIGLLTWQIVDAIDIYLKADDTILRQTGIMGSSIIEGRTTLIIDIFDMVENLFPEWFTQRKKNNVSDEESITILLAEDSTFFRGQVKKSLEDEGYSIIEAEDGSIAWDLLKENKDSVSLVVTDIEMPNLDGLGLTQKIKTDEKFSHLPVIALTTLASDEDILRGKDAGVDDYQIKLDKEKLLASISSILQ